jgi:hypothetical protein
MRIAWIAMKIESWEESGVAEELGKGSIAWADKILAQITSSFEAKGCENSVATI